jgi:hypothetical protein
MKTAFKVFGFVLLLATFASGQCPTRASRTAGRYEAALYNYGGSSVCSATPGVVNSGSTSTGAYTITLRSGTITLQDGRTIVPYSVTAPIIVGIGSVAETVTPTAVSGCAKNAPPNSCQITATFTNAHGAGTQVASGSAGLQEAINDAQNSPTPGGIVAVDKVWAENGGTSTMVTAALPYHQVAIEDSRSGPVQFYNISQAATTALATPATLTAVTAAPSATPVGAFGTGTYHMCISYVDVMGNEGTCSADFSEAGLATGSFIFTAPAASTGAVGYTIYISLTSGTYALSYKVPLSNTICTLTKIETVTNACAVTNATYGQTGATATVTAITVNTAMLAPNASTISSTTDYVPNPNARTTYAYQPSNRVALPGIVGASLPFPTAAAAATTVPAVIGTLTLPAGFMNYVGRTIEICGYATQAANGSTATISNIQLWWDAAGSNAAGVPVLIGTNPSTNTLVTAKTDQFYFCYDLKTTVAGASVTAGSILQTGGTYINQYTSSGVATVPVVSLGQGPAAVGSLNLAGEARIDIVWLHTTGTDANGLVLQDLTVKVLN